MDRKRKEFQFKNDEGRWMIKHQGGPRTGRQPSMSVTYSFLEDTVKGMHEAVTNGEINMRQLSLLAEVAVREYLSRRFGIDFDSEIEVKPEGMYVAGPRSRLSNKQREALGIKS